MCAGHDVPVMTHRSLSLPESAPRRPSGKESNQPPVLEGKQMQSVCISVGSGAVPGLINTRQRRPSGEESNWPSLTYIAPASWRVKGAFAKINQGSGPMRF